MTQAAENDKQAPKDRDDHFDEANPMPDTHHVNPEPDHDSFEQRKNKQ